MRRVTLKTLLFSMWGALLVWMTAASVVFGRDPDPRAGLEVFRGKGCVRCHPILGEGANIGPDLSQGSAAAGGLDLVADMWNHAPRMWERIRQEKLQIPTFAEQEMEDLFAFVGMVRSLDDPGNVEAGRKLFQTKRCVECHAIKGQGGSVGPELADVPRSQNPIAWAAAMWNHAPGMFRALSTKGIPVPELQGDEMMNLGTFIRVTAGWKKDNSIYLRPSSPSRGQTLFQSKQCIRCHSIQGRGGTVGPDLGRVSLPQKYGEIAAVMWNHAPQMLPLMEGLGIPHPNFETQELADLLAYLNSLSLGPAGNPEAGARVFADKGCSHCHAVRPGETSLGPNLSTIEISFSPASVARNLWNHGPIMLKNMQRIALPWPLFESRELADALAYLESIRNSSSPAPRSGTLESSTAK